MKLNMINPKTRKKLATRFQPEPRVDLELNALTFLRPAQGTQLELLKRRLVQELVSEKFTRDLDLFVERAAVDAEALAWTTEFPLLFFPTLLEEKALTAQLQLGKQKQVRARSQQIFEDAVA